jgi:hypothetical protein
VNDLKPRWEEIVEHVQSGSSEGDIIIFYPDYKQEPFDYYYGGDITELGIDEEVPIEYVNSTLDTVVQYYDRMWFVLNWEGEEALLTGYLHQKFGADSVKQKTGISDMTVVLVEPS